MKALRWLVGAAVAVALAAGAAAAPMAGGTLSIGLDQEPPTLDPHASPSAVTYQIIADVTESLMYEGPDGRIVPWLATAYTLSPDGRSFTFTLQRGATFSDGAPLDAEAVKWNLDRIVRPDFKAGVALTALTGYTGASVVDDHTVRITFKEPYAPFLTYLAGGWLALLSPKATAAQGGAVNLKPVGSGPFAVAEYAPKDHITLARNAQYNRRAPWSDHAGPARLERVVWKIIPESSTRVATVQSGETQMINFQSVPAGVLPRLAADKSLRVEKTPYPGISRVWLLNVRQAPTNEIKVRQAIAYGVNRAAFVESIFKGLGTVACAPLTQQTLPTPALCAAYRYDPKKAAQLLDEAGWKMGAGNIRAKDGRPLAVVINSINYGAGNLPEIELLQGQLLQLGIDARIKSQARPPWFEDNYHCATNGPVLFLRDPDMNGLAALFASANIGGNFNWSCYANPDVDRLLADGRTQFEPTKRRAAYMRIEQILLEQAVAVPLVDELSVWIVRASMPGTKYNYSGYPVLSDAVVGR
jgi:peptide/nickel transport system substrate-binding protein